MDKVKKVFDDTDDRSHDKRGAVIVLTHGLDFLLTLSTKIGKEEALKKVSNVFCECSENTFFGVFEIIAGDFKYFVIEDFAITFDWNC